MQHFDSYKIGCFGIDLDDLEWHYIFNDFLLEKQ